MTKGDKYKSTMPRKRKYRKPTVEKREEEKPIVPDFGTLPEEPEEEVAIQETVAAEPVAVEDEKDLSAAKAALEEPGPNIPYKPKPVKVYGDWPRKPDGHCEKCGEEIVFGRDAYQSLGGGRLFCAKHKLDT